MAPGLRKNDLRRSNPSTAPGAVGTPVMFDETAINVSLISGHIRTVPLAASDDVSLALGSGSRLQATSMIAQLSSLRVPLLSFPQMIVGMIVPLLPLMYAVVAIPTCRRFERH